MLETASDDEADAVRQGTETRIGGLNRTHKVKSRNVRRSSTPGGVSDSSFGLRCAQWLSFKGPVLRAEPRVRELIAHIIELTEVTTPSRREGDIQELALAR